MGQLRNNQLLEIQRSIADKLSTVLNTIKLMRLHPDDVIVVRGGRVDALSLCRAIEKTHPNARNPILTVNELDDVQFLDADDMKKLGWERTSDGLVS